MNADNTCICAGFLFGDGDMVSIQDMKKLRDIITDRFGVSPSVAGRVIGYYNGSGRGEIVAAMIAGDLSGVAPALAALGVNTSENTPEPSPEKISTAAGDPGEKISSEPVTRSKTARNASRTKEKKTSATPLQDQHKSGAAWGVATSPAALQTEPGKDQPQHDQLETVAGEIVTDDTHDGLPDGLADMIYSAVDSFCKKHDFENMSKCRQSAWGACCSYIGQTIFKPNRKILAGPPPKNGGFCYDTEKLSRLADLWSHMCGVYGKAPLVDDFANFAGVDEVTIYASTGKYTDMQHITPARVRLLQKLHAMQEKGLAGLIVDGRQNPTGALAALNHWHGWTQTREIIHTAGQGSQAAAALPVFGPAGEMLPEKSAGD